MVLGEEMKASQERIIKQSLNESMEKSSDVEIILRNAGILQSRNMFGMLFLKQSLTDSRNLQEKEKDKTEKFNLGDSIDGNLHFLQEPKAEDMEVENNMF